MLINISGAEKYSSLPVVIVGRNWVSWVGYFAFPQRRVIPLVVLVVLLLNVIAVARAEEMVVGRFSAADLAGWQEHVFKGKTRYQFASSEGKTVLAARSSKSASGYLLRKPGVKAATHPLLRWSWKITQPVAGENPDQKAGDDFAARVYVVFPGRFFWQTRAICYVWSGVMAPGTFRPSPFSKNVVNVAVAGAGDAGHWRIEERNYVADFKRYFGGEPPNPEAIGIMTDSDNTGGEAEAWYGDIIFGTR